MQAPVDRPPVGSDEWRRGLHAVGTALREANVGSIYLMHGTFVGDDGWGFWQRCASFWPALGRGRLLQKKVLDGLVRDIGNYTGRFASEFALGIDAELQGEGNADATATRNVAERPSAASHSSAGTTRGLAVRRWTWSSQNNHVGRAEAAMRFILELADRPADDRRRVLVWGHSHAGNVMALVTNLLTVDEPTRRAFFDALRPYDARWSRESATADSLLKHDWQWAQDVLASDGERLRSIPLDIVTFGTPIRYGWDTAGYARLLHIVHSRPNLWRSRRAHGLPYRAWDAWLAREGDYVQRSGIAGTNLPPCWLLKRPARRADRALHALLQQGVASRGLFDRLRPTLRVADEGPTVAVDYGPQRGGPLAHLFGHGEYTRRRQLCFHAQLVARLLYGMSETAFTDAG